MGVDVEHCVAFGKPDARASSEAYFLSGRSSMDETLAFWEDTVGAALGTGGFAFERSVGEMTWALRTLPGRKDLFDYESRLNRFMPRYP